MLYALVTICRIMTSACLLQTLISRLFSNFQDSSYLLIYTSLASHASKNTMCIFHNHYETWNMKQYQEQVLVENQKFPRNPTTQDCFKVYSSLQWLEFIYACCDPCKSWNSLVLISFSNVPLHCLKNWLKRGCLFYVCTVQCRLHQHNSQKKNLSSHCLERMTTFNLVTD